MRWLVFTILLRERPSYMLLTRGELSRARPTDLHDVDSTVVRSQPCVVLNWGKSSRPETIRLACRQAETGPEHGKPGEGLGPASAKGILAVVERQRGSSCFVDEVGLLDLVPSVIFPTSVDRQWGNSSCTEFSNCRLRGTRPGEIVVCSRQPKRGVESDGERDGNRKTRLDAFLITPEHRNHGQEHERKKIAIIDRLKSRTWQQQDEVGEGDGDEKDAEIAPGDA